MPEAAVQSQAPTLAVSLGRTSTAGLNHHMLEGDEDPVARIRWQEETCFRNTERAKSKNLLLTQVAAF